MSKENVYLEPVDVRSEAFAYLMAEYPYGSDVDGVEELPQVVFTSGDGAPFTARVLGFGSSFRESHLNHAPGERPPKGVRCSGCRWTDTAILKQVGTDYYVYVSCGKSVVEGENQRDTVVWTQSAQDVLRLMFVPTKPGFTRDKGKKAIPPHNGAAFRDAACVDTALAALLEQFADLIPEPPEQGIDPLAGL